MPTGADSGRVRQRVLETIRDHAGIGQGGFEPQVIMQETAKRYGDQAGAEVMRSFLSCWNDLLRGGIIAFGIPPDQWSSRHFHVTPEGEKTLEHASRDPINQTGYLAYLDQQAPLDPITRDYVEEALNTYRACCYKATAVLIGAAVESLVLILRDELLARLKKRATKPPKGLEAWQVKTALEAVAKHILPDLDGEARKKGDEALRHLYEDAQARLYPVAAEFRKTRNDAGHPASLSPVNPADVHANLLLFPSTAKLLQRLTKWVINYYQ